MKKVLSFLIDSPKRFLDDTRRKIKKIWEYDLFPPMELPVLFINNFVSKL